ncbi:nibrin homolog [Euphorbia lathyris]|uniref:nibrin homolog n=1 Tax=Euphorbia lathyris TaxID=212925 RepID=UPI00331414D9
MVWALFPVDPLSGEEKYYIFNKGTYKVGRKGCDVIISKDKGVSRIHAEIVVDEMTLLNPEGRKSNRSSGVRVRDCSKYGTFINNNLGSKEKVHEFPNKEKTLNDGDLVSFGTGNATYRFSCVPLIFYICYSAESFQVNNPLQDKVSSIGARISSQLSEECTHVLIDHHMSLDNDVIDAIVANKPVVLLSWVELVAEKSIGTEFPTWSSFIPTLKVHGVPVQVVDSVTRANCLKGYACLLEAKDMYKFGDSFPSLLAVAGANVISIEEFCSNSQSVDYVENFRIICVVPQGSADKFGRFSKLSSLSRVNEVDLLCAVISGCLDSSKLVLPTVLISSSCSTDETIVADSDEEVEVETKSMHVAASICIEESPKYVEKVEINKVELSTVHHPLAKLGDSYVLSSVENHVGMTAKREKLEEPETTNSDIIYSQDLIIRDWNLPVATTFTYDNVINFKRFRKKNTESGNSFNNLIPFAKYPYKNSDHEDQGIIESVKEEKKRKQMEAIAEDLFNNEKGKGRQRGTLHSLLSRR